LSHLGGQAVIRLYRCQKCGEQLMLPVDAGANEAAGAEPAAAVAQPAVAAPPPAKKGFLSRIFGA